jgi:hypothetical protein
MMYRITASAVVMVLVMMLASSLLAGGNSEYDPNEIAVFLGDTRYEGTGAFTLGAGYEYRWNATAGIGFIFEYVLGDRMYRDYVLGLPFYVHPFGGMRFFAAPLFVSQDEDGNSVSRGALRVGFAYAIPAGDFSFTPKFNFDFMNEKVHTVYGVAFGYRF